MRTILCVAGAMMLALPLSAQTSRTAAGSQSTPSASGQTIMKGSPEQPVALIETSMGNIQCVLFPKAAPVGTKSFIAFARGTKDWTNPKTGKKMHGVPLYDGTTFHRVIPEFMIQGGDPRGNGTGGSGNPPFKNETVPGLTFDRGGRLAYANSGPDTNDTQFFVTEKATPWLENNYTIFGQCDDASVEVVKKIARVPRGGDDKPNTPVVIKHVKIDDGTAAKAPVTRRPVARPPRKTVQ